MITGTVVPKPPPRQITEGVRITAGLPYMMEEEESRWVYVEDERRWYYRTETQEITMLRKKEVS